jgi:hypothetical protein
MGEFMRRTIVATAAITAAMGANLLTTPTVASAAEAETCHIWADPPIQVGPGLIGGVGHRAGCVQRRDITVRIRMDITRWPDKTVAQSSRSGVINVDLGT